MVEKMRTLGNDVAFKGSKAFAEENVLEIACLSARSKGAISRFNVEGGVLKSRERIQGSCD